MPQPSLHAVADDGVAYGLAHNETRTRRGMLSPRRVRVFLTTEMDDEERAPGPASSAYCGREVLAPPQPVLGRQHGMDLWSGCSGRQTGATLAPAVRDDRAAGAGPHAQPKAVGLRAPAVVRLEGALAHSGAPEVLRVPRVSRDGCWGVDRLSPCAHEQLVYAGVCTASIIRGAPPRSCPSEAGGSSRRQLDLVTVRAATPGGQTEDTSDQPTSSPCTPCGQRLECGVCG